MIVRAIPRGYAEEYRRVSGEHPFCERFDPIWNDCDGRAEVEIRMPRGRETRTVFLCRECATSLAVQLRECVNMVDGGEVFAE